MTPFDSWYAAHVEPNLPKDFPPQLRAAGKAEAAKVWNAALDAACERATPDLGPNLFRSDKVSYSVIRSQIIAAVQRIKVTP